MPATKYLPVSWNEYHTLAQSLAAKILKSQESFDEIVAIARGGLTLGHLLSDFLAIPVSTITIQSYTDIQKQGELKITGRLTKPIRQKSILLVDDVADSGKTLNRATVYLKRFHPKAIITATMFYKPHSVFRPDHYVKRTSKWILFPYEPAEMIRLISSSLAKEGKSQEAIHVFLSTLNYTENQIRFVQRYYQP
ncbi:phosphoribosyltransferase [Candidatus Gottesmanbacteria bacterium]|nr:phosphoribosyltransferase [Candidatus Gottesmanbacteria bacterium]